MPEGSDLLFFASMMLATGVAGGLLAGLLGVGGGIVIVPVLEFTLGVYGVDPAISMHVAVATSLAIIIPTSISSARAHQRRGAVDIELVRLWAIMIFIGAIVGTIIAGFVKSSILSAVFGITALVVAIKMLLPTGNIVLAQEVPRGVPGGVIPSLIGTISTMMGIGGGTLSVPILTLLNYPIHRAVGTAALFGLIISLPGTVGFIVSGWHDPRLPVASLGFVNLLGFALIAPTTYLAAPWGAKIAHSLGKEKLAFAFGVFLLIVACRMIYRTISG